MPQQRTHWPNLSIQARTLWAAAPPLTFTTFLMLAALLGALIALPLDPRIITGVPAWAKPAKFAISTAIFSATAAWLFTYVHIRPRFKRLVSWTLAVALNLEVAIIYLQAARGTTSHFNFSTPLDGILFGIMGAGIAVLWLAMIAALILLWRQQSEDRAWGWALRLGMLISVIGAGAGGMMVRPTASERAEIAEHRMPSHMGGHTVGAPDGGEGLPFLNWSARHGDLRIPHFAGLHAVQLVPLASWLMLRRLGKRSTPKRLAVVAVIAGSYMALISILGWQALRGQSLIEPDRITWIVWTSWAAATLAALFWLWADDRQQTASQVSRVGAAQ